MHLGTTITGVLLVVACVLPLVLASRKRKKKEHQLLNDLQTFADKFNAKIADHELWNGTAIGLDKNLMKLFFIRTTSGVQFEREVSLAEVKSAKIAKTGKSTKGKDGDVQLIEKLELELLFTDPNKPRVLLEFYDCNRDNITLSGELQLLDKWVKYVNELLDDLKKSKRHF